MEVYGTSNFDALGGTEYDDDFYAYGGDDWLMAYGGNDYLFGGTGGDDMYGGLGNDVYEVEDMRDHVIENFGEGTDTVWAYRTYTLTANVENLVLYTTWGYGNDLNNRIIGDQYFNEMEGRGGNDYLDGGGSADRMIGGTGDDTYVVDTYPDSGSRDEVIEQAGGGFDTVLSYARFYTLPDHVENLVLTGSYAEYGIGNSLFNTITGTSANDILNGRGGIDTLIGGRGSDIYVISDDANDVIMENAGEDTDAVEAYLSFTLPANVEILWLFGSDTDGTGNALDNEITVYEGSGDRTLEGRGGNDTLTSLSGDDLLDGGTGADTMNGGRGDDIYVIDDYADTIIETAGNGIDTVRSGLANYTLGANLENLELTASAFNGDGNSLDNHIIGNFRQNFLTGGEGNDILDGGELGDSMNGNRGNDTYYVDHASDFVYEAANQGYDTVNSSVTWTLDTNIENLNLLGTARINGTGNGGDNTIVGNSNRNVLNGLSGNDDLTGGEDNDTLNGGVGNDTLDGGAGGDALNGGDDYDTVLYLSAPAGVTADLATSSNNTGFAAGDTYSSIERVFGSDFDDTLRGDGNANVLKGAGGHDHLFGGGGNDELQGGTGNDELDGGAGQDVLTGASGNDTITGDGDAGIDTYGGGDGTDTLDFSPFGSAVWIDLAYTGTPNEVWTRDRTSLTTGTWREIADVDGIENLVGTVHSDQLYGDGGNNVLSYTGGLDRFDGRGGTDTADFSRFGSAVWVDLAYTGTPNEAWTRDGTSLTTGTWREIADLSNIENLVGTVHSDQLLGDGGNNVLFYTGGLDRFDGRGGADTADFSRFGSAVWVDLAYTGTPNEAWTQDDVDLVGGTWREIADLSNTENLTGTRHADLLFGDGGANRLEGGAGNDTLTGRGGNDTFVFRTGSGQDTIADFTGNGVLRGDVVELSLGTAFDTLGEVLAVASQVGSSVVFSFGGGNTLTLSNATLGNLHQNDFLFS